MWTSRSTGLPVASPAVTPNSRSAAQFQSRTVPSVPIATKASVAVSSTARTSIESESERRSAPEPGKRIPHLRNVARARRLPCTNLPPD